MKVDIPSANFHAFVERFRDVRAMEKAATGFNREYHMGKRFGLVDAFSLLTGMSWFEAMDLIEAAK